MKTKFTLLVLLLAALATTNAQTTLLNGGFESWTSGSPSYPTSWDTYDHLIQTVGAGTIPQKGWCTKDSLPANVTAGNYSARLRTDSTTGLGVVTGAVSYGTMVLVGGQPSLNGQPFTGRPVTFGGDIKYAPHVSDTASYEILLTKWDATGDSEIVVGFYGVRFLSTGNAFYHFNDTIQYMSALTPDSVQILFNCSNSGAPTEVGSILWVDNLSITYTTTGLVHLDLDDAVQVFPNPASSQLNIKVDEYMKGYTFEVYDITGRLVKRNLIENSTTSLDISGLSNGTYVYRLSNTDNKSVTQNKFVVVK